MLAAVVVVYGRFFREQPAPQFESDEDQFLFGSVGTEASDGLPYWVWLVLPRIFPDLLPGPGGYTALGIQSKEGYEMPIGLSRVTVGYPRVGINCAMCHTPGNRTPPADAVARRYTTFLASAAADPRFTPATILGEIAKNARLSAVDRLLYRFVIIPSTRAHLLEQKERADLWDHAATRRLPAVERARAYLTR
ncbi:MAG TPA: hypothetical protein VIX63_18415 [Vicinamibacterales bacterium]